MVRPVQAPKDLGETLVTHVPPHGRFPLGVWDETSPGDETTFSENSGPGALGGR